MMVRACSLFLKDYNVGVSGDPLMGDHIDPSFSESSYLYSIIIL